MKKLLPAFVSTGFLALAIIAAAGMYPVSAQTAAPVNPPAATADTTTAAAEQPVSMLDRIKNWFYGLTKTPPSQQDKAVLEARAGKYDDALAILDKLHQHDPNNQSVTRDYAAVLGWAGRDAEAVAYYETLPPVEPDYVLASIGHSYRQLNKTDRALSVYRIGVQQYPTSVTFAEGEIRCIADQGDLDSALAKANADLAKNGNRPEIVAAKDDITQAIVKREDQKAVELGREKNYTGALPILQDLHTKFPNNTAVTQDYLAVLGWAEGHDADVVALYKTLPGDEPDYVLEAVGHSYRKLNQPENAFPVYQQGMQKYPDNVTFTEGAIRSLVDQKKYDDALTMANEDLKAHGNRPEIVDIKKNILRLMPHKKGHKAAAKKHHH